MWWHALKQGKWGPGRQPKRQGGPDAQMRHLGRLGAAEVQSQRRRFNYEAWLLVASNGHHGVLEYFFEVAEFTEVAKMPNVAQMPKVPRCP